MNNLMSLSVEVIDKLGHEEMMFITGGDKPVVPPPNNGSGTCGGSNNASGLCSGPNNADGLCSA